MLCMSRLGYIRTYCYEHDYYRLSVTLVQCDDISRDKKWKSAQDRLGVLATCKADPDRVAYPVIQDMTKMWSFAV